MSDSGNDDVVFDGINGLASDAFIRTVRRRALAQGFHKDDEWTAQSAAASLGGIALDWYEDQSEEVQDSWKLLRRAILARWPTSALPTVVAAASAAAPPCNSNIPTAAAAPPALSSIASTLVNLGQKKWRIRVLSEEDGTFFGYISRILNANGNHKVSEDVLEALLVWFAPSRGLQSLVHSTSSLSEKRLGITLDSGDSAPLEVGQRFIDQHVYWGFPSTITSNTSSSALRSSCKSIIGTPRSAIWRVLFQGEIIAVWEARQAMECILTIVMFLHPDVHGSMAFTTDYEGFQEQCPGDSMCKVSLVLEPVDE